MKLTGSVAVRVAGEVILRKPRFWDKVKRAFGGEPDLRTGAMRAALEAGAVVDAVRDALISLGATNAVSLVVDDLVLFQDREGRPDDLGDLFLAFHEQSAAIGGEFKLLRLAVEHVEAGLHLILEVQARGEHPAEEAAVRVVIGGRIAAFEPKRGESADAYRARVEPLAKDSATIELARMQFDSFVARVRDAIAAAMPEAHAMVVRAELQVRRPSERPAAEPSPTAPTYDPYYAYYPSPLWVVSDMIMWSALWSMTMHSHVTVIDHAGHALGNLDSPGISEDMPDVDVGDGLGDAADGVGDAADGIGDGVGDAADGLGDAFSIFD
jgi:hypothetical protein